MDSLPKHPQQLRLGQVEAEPGCSWEPVTLLLSHEWQESSYWSYPLLPSNDHISRKLRWRAGLGLKPGCPETGCKPVNQNLHLQATNTQARTTLDFMKPSGLWKPVISRSHFPRVSFRRELTQSSFHNSLMRSQIGQGALHFRHQDKWQNSEPFGQRISSHRGWACLSDPPAWQDRASTHHPHHLPFSKLCWAHSQSAIQWHYCNAEQKYFQGPLEGSGT